MHRRYVLYLVYFNTYFINPPASRPDKKDHDIAYGLDIGVQEESDGRTTKYQKHKKYLKRRKQKRRLRERIRKQLIGNRDRDSSL